MYEGILEFKGKWRTYQDRVLKHADQYCADEKIHIVAAPGSGKTTLGIELIRRLDQKALVLAPSITIREQWAARIQEAFLCQGVKIEDYVSQNLKAPKTITVVTYQALHSAMTRYKGIEQEQASEENPEDIELKAETVDYSGFDVVSVMKKENIGVLCLDECHHLRSEWWKALQDFKNQMGSLKVIALTATPPYDDTPAMWTRYMDMCGEIDEEITIPELVKEGSLCPHQDYVYFNYPTREEEKELKEYEKRGEAMLLQLMEDNELLSHVRTHPALNGEKSDDTLLDDPSYLASLLIYMQSKQVPFPKRLQRLLGAKRLPDMEGKWMERLLQGFLYDDADSYICDKDYREALILHLKQEGLIEKRKVALTTNTKVEKMLTNSVGKCSSIREITFHEYGVSGKALRLLILTDYIRKEYEKAVGDSEKDMNALGVIPFFEMLRRENEKREEGIRLGVLCGTIVVIPAEAREQLEIEIEGCGAVTYSRIGCLDESEYLKVTPVGDGHFLTAAVTSLFTKGYMQVLIGTKSLLGEGWDAPCVNSLILASFVGSFMLSNQMRGRSIRVWKENPEKTSNIWHLVCLRPWSDVRKDTSGQISQDFSMLERRMEHFLGLHYEEETIENGIQRLSIIKAPFDKINVKRINNKMLAMSGERRQLKDRWKNALAVFDKIEVVNETDVKDKFVTMTVFFDALRNMILSALLAVIFVFAMVAGRGRVFFGIGAIVALGFMMGAFPKIFMLGSPLRRLKAFGNGVRKAMIDQGLLESENTKAVSENVGPDHHMIYLAGGSGRDKALFTQCVSELFDEVDNQRYLLVKKKRHKGLDGFYCVPECFSKRREDAEAFRLCMKPFIGDYLVVYTRNEKGREILLEGRVKALANREERCIKKKRVKGALE